jgi:hypothetical protein
MANCFQITHSPPQFLVVLELIAGAYTGTASPPTVQWQALLDCESLIRIWRMISTFSERFLEENRPWPLQTLIDRLADYLRQRHLTINALKP